MKTYIAVPLLLISILCTCPSAAQQSHLSIEAVKWLVGTWENHTPRGIIYESWEVTNSQELSAKSYKIQGSDTMILETVKILIQNNILQYIPVVRDQNQGKPVVFTSTYVSPSKFIVEAPDHDYPQMISYTRIGKDQLVAEISGPVKGKYQYQTFYMVRNSEL